MGFLLSDGVKRRSSNDLTRIGEDEGLEREEEEEPSISILALFRIWGREDGTISRGSPDVQNMSFVFTVAEGS